MKKNIHEKKGLYKEDTSVQPLTLFEQLKKGNKIDVKFLGIDEKKPLKNLQLAIFVNGSLKYASKKGVFTVTTLTFPTLRRKGWKIYCEKVQKDRIIFKNDKDYKKFIGFCTELRDCVRIQELYNQLCFDFVKTFEAEESQEKAI